MLEFSGRCLSSALSVSYLHFPGLIYPVPFPPEKISVFNIKEVEKELPIKTVFTVSKFHEMN